MRENGVDNVWMQPLDGSPGHPVTDFKSEQIWSFGLHPMGRTLPFCTATTIPTWFCCKETKP